MRAFRRGIGIIPALFVIDQENFRIAVLVELVCPLPESDCPTVKSLLLCLLNFALIHFEVLIVLLCGFGHGI
jgi:hypothetical protein